MKKLLFITFSELDDSKSGSTVRPRKMLEAFRNLDLEIDTLDGQGLIFKNKNRNKKIKQLLNDLENKTYDYCYIESMSGPISSHYDRKLIKKLHEKNIKIAYFLRDDYFRLGGDYLQKTFKNFVLKKYDKLFSYFSNKTLDKYVDIVYFPSLSFSEYFSFKRKDELQPAGEIIEKENTCNENIGIYVGSCSKAYGTDLLLNLFDRLNDGEEKFELNIITNVDLFKQNYESFLDRSWLHLIKASGKELVKYYDSSKVAFLLKDKNLYSDLSVSIKIYEYFSYGKSVVFTDCIEQRKIAEKSKAAIVVNNPITDKDVLDVKDIFKRDDLNKNAKEFIKNGNTWLDRAKKVINDLENIK